MNLNLLTREDFACAEYSFDIWQASCIENHQRTRERKIERAKLYATNTIRDDTGANNPFFLRKAILDGGVCVEDGESSQKGAHQPFQMIDPYSRVHFLSFPSLSRIVRAVTPRVFPFLSCAHVHSNFSPLLSERETLCINGPLCSKFTLLNARTEKSKLQKSFHLSCLTRA